jgi:ATP-binding cassette subfamily F protein 3
MRLNLAQALMCPSELLLLDEPTNHLDIDAIIWLEDWLKRYTGTLLVISHDRDFLDGVVNAIVHIDQKKLRRYGGDYSSFETQRAQNLVLAQHQVEKQTRERAHLQSFIDRFKASAAKAKQAQSRVKRLAKLSGTEAVRAERQIHINFSEPAKIPHSLLRLNHVDAGYTLKGAAHAGPSDHAVVEDHGHAVILENVKFGLEAGDRIGLLGPNGAGKSTLVKTLVGELPVLAGERTAHPDMVLGYFAQHTVESLHEGQSPIDHLRDIAPGVSTQASSLVAAHEAERR